jgi:hypothetical protein
LPSTAVLEAMRDQSTRPDSLDTELSHLRGFPFSEKVDWNRFNPRMLITPHSQKTAVPNHTEASVFEWVASKS